MRRILKALTAIIAVAALPLVAVAPASAAAANPYDIYFEFDCNEHYWDYDVPLYGDTATIHFVNCAVGNYLQDADDTGFASTTSVVIDDVTENAIGTVTATGPVEIKVIAGPNQPGLVDDEHFANIIIFDPEVQEIADPAGSLLVDESAEIPLEANLFTVEDPNADDEIMLGGNDLCLINEGEHVYSTLEFTVTTAGDYTFRVMGTDPISSYIDEDADSIPLDDPMVALYNGTFDPASPHTGIAGCNDDFKLYEDLNGVNWAEIYDNLDGELFAETEDGTLIEGHFPIFESSLTPGQYTLVFTTWEVVTEADWAGGGGWEPSAMSLDYEVWGPSNGLTVGHNLAATGVDPSFGLWAGLGLIGTGAAVAVARRRAARA
jgi:hypothetical protein